MTDEPKKFDLVVNEEGVVVIGDMETLKKKLDGNLRDILFVHLPDEFFRRQVQEVFESLMAPREAPATGDLRCDDCKRGWSKRETCPHVKVPAPSTIQGMIYAAFYKEVQKKANELVERWASESITDSHILEGLERLVVEAAKAWQRNMGASIVQSAVQAIRGDFVACNRMKTDDHGNPVYCGATTLRGIPCPKCGNITA